MRELRTMRGFGALAALAIIVSACSNGGTGNTSSSTGSSSSASASAGGNYAIGYSNGGGVGNGFREEQVCTARQRRLPPARSAT